MPDEVVALEAGRLHQRLDVIRHLQHRVRRPIARRLRLAVAAMVERQHAMSLRKLRQLVTPVRDVAGVSVHEHQRLAGVAVHLVVQLDAVDRRVRHVASPHSASGLRS